MRQKSPNYAGIRQIVQYGTILWSYPFKTLEQDLKNNSKKIGMHYFQFIFYLKMLSFKPMDPYCFQKKKIV